MQRKLVKRILCRVSLVGALALCTPCFAVDGVVTTCTEPGFASVLNTVISSGGGGITFSCGVGPVTIPFTSYKAISGSAAVVIDGANAIVFDGGAGNSAFFQISSSASLALQRLTLQHGKFNMVHPLENFGFLKIDRSTISQNVSADSAIVNESSGKLVVLSSQLVDNQITGAGAGAAVLNRGGTVQIVRSIFSNNSVAGAPGDGGAISNSSGSMLIKSSMFTGNSASTNGGAVRCLEDTLTISSSAFGSNTAGLLGGAIYSACASTVDNSTFDSNSATNIIGGGGGAIYKTGLPTANLSHITVSRNTASAFGGGIYNEAGTMFLQKSLVASNVNSTMADNCAGTIDSFGYNVVNGTCTALMSVASDRVNASLPLGPFVDNGGPLLSNGMATFTSALMAGNEAINTIPAASCVSFDQRFATRAPGGGCDSGAYELGGDLTDSIFMDQFEY